MSDFPRPNIPRGVPNSTLKRKQPAYWGHQPGRPTMIRRVIRLQQVVKPSGAAKGK